MAYNFRDQDIPGLNYYEEPAYWRDVGTISAYWQANMDLIGSWLFSDVCRLYKRIELFVADRLGNSSVFESADNFLSVEIFNGDSHLYLANK